MNKRTSKTQAKWGEYFAAMEAGKQATPPAMGTSLRLASRAHQATQCHIIWVQVDSKQGLSLDISSMPAFVSALIRMSGRELGIETRLAAAATSGEAAAGLMATSSGAGGVLPKSEMQPLNPSLSIHSASTHMATYGLLGRTRWLAESHPCLPGAGTRSGLFGPAQFAQLALLGLTSCFQCFQ